MRGVGNKWRAVMRGRGQGRKQGVPWQQKCQARTLCVRAGPCIFPSGKQWREGGGGQSAVYGSGHSYGMGVVDLLGN